MADDDEFDKLMAEAEDTINESQDSTFNTTVIHNAADSQEQDFLIMISIATLCRYFLIIIKGPCTRFEVEHVSYN